MMTRKLRIVAGVIGAAALSLHGAGASAQSPSPFIDGIKTQYGIVKGYLAKTIEKVPEDILAFKPTPEVRNFGQIVGHVADAQFMICAAAAGEKPPQGDIEKTATTKAALSKALAESTAYCDKILGGMTDKQGMEPVAKFFFPNQTRASVLAFNVAHGYEHYGNLVTYMRLNKIVPPSSEAPTK
jgi:uncharacterized damage-inducible protein DinB